MITIEMNLSALGSLEFRLAQSSRLIRIVKNRSNLKAFERDFYSKFSVQGGFPFGLRSALRKSAPKSCLYNGVSINGRLLFTLLPVKTKSPAFRSDCRTSKLSMAVSDKKFGAFNLLSN